MVHLTLQSQNITPAGKTLVSRWSAGRLRWREGASIKAISDNRGPVVASVGMRRTSPRQATVVRMIARYEAGATLREVADEFGVHRMTVSRALKRAGAMLRRAGLDEQGAQRAAELYAGGKTLVEVGAELGVAGSTVRRALLNAGVHLRAPLVPRKNSERTP